MIEIGMGSVQSWDCDMMGHLNVQHYVARAVDSLASLAIPLGLGPRRLRESGLRLVPVDHHIRFLKELRPGAAFTLYGGAIEVRDDALHLYQETRLTLTGAVAATFRTEAVLVDTESRRRQALPSDVADRAGRLAVTVPEHGSPRGLALQPPRTQPSWAEADANGLILSQQGAVATAECDRDGYMLPQAFMGRVSDAIPNMIAQSRGIDRTSRSKTGGAALEYRLVYHATPRAGDVVAVRSGVKAVTRKAFIWVHWLFDLETGLAAATTESVAVSFDLEARKAVEIDPAIRQALEPHLIPSLSV